MPKLNSKKVREGKKERKKERKRRRLNTDRENNRLKRKSESSICYFINILAIWILLQILRVLVAYQNYILGDQIHWTMIKLQYQI